ncbi:MAG: hypothetical protein ACYS8W_15025 [Planctomycetota bacterium]|jgi:hypothetical protein
MLRIIFRVMILLCLLAAPVVTIACAKTSTVIEEEEHVIDRQPETIVTGD